MKPSKLVEAAEAVAQIPDEATLSVSSSSALGCPDKVLAAIGTRFRETGYPKNLTSLHPIAAGDMYGVPGIDHLAQDGLLKRVIAGSYPSGPSSMPSPAIWRMIFENRVEAYNLPSGVLYHMHSEAAAGRPGVLTKVGLETFVDPCVEGGRMNACTTQDVVERLGFKNELYLFYPAISVDVAIIRATTADEAGNLTMEHEGAPLGVLEQALAARANGGLVIAQVKRVVAAGTLSAQQVRVPGALVDFVVLDPDQHQTTETPYDPAISGEVKRPLSSFEPPEWNIEKVIARRASLELRRGDIVNLGFGISALVPYVLLEEGLHGAVTWVIEQGAVGGLPLRDFGFGCASNADALIPSPLQFVLFQGGGFQRALLSFMQVDASGNVNVSKLSAKLHVTAGVGGFIDITHRCPHLVFSGTFTAGGLKTECRDGELRILQEGKAKKFVPQVEQVTMSGKQTQIKGQRVTYVTERCVLELTQNGLMITEVAPGIDMEKDILAQAEIPLEVSSDVKEMARSLFRQEGLGEVLKGSLG